MIRLLSISMALLVALAAYGGGSITILNDRVITGKRIELGEIASIEGWKPREQILLASLDIGRAPNQGRWQPLKTIYIKQKVHAAMGRNKDFDFAAAPMVRVRSQGIEISSERLSKGARKFVLEQTGWKPENVEITMFREPDSIFLPTGKYDLDFKALSADFYGPTLIKVLVHENGFERAFRTVRLKICRTLPVLVAAKSLQSGVELSKDDMLLRRRPVTGVSQEGRLLRDASLLQGKKLRRLVDKGNPILISYLDNPPEVKKGDEMQVIVKCGSITIKSRGEATRTGRIGERIPIDINGRILWAKVLDQGLAIAEVK
jgi:flagella basal body P-ring formation protein FlgA